MSLMALYRAAGALGAPLIALYLWQRKRKGKEDPQRFAERQGHAGIVRPLGPVVWIHGASVGESLSMLPLIERLRAHPSDPAVLVTTGTVTSAKLMTERLPEGAFHQFVPVDRRPWVKRFLDHWKPDLVLWTESELWPNLVRETAKRDVPMVLINGRMSAKSFRGWMRVPGFAKRLLSGFDLCLGQTGVDAERFRLLGAPRSTCVGNLKFAAPPLPAGDAELDRFERALVHRPRWLAASTHAGEEEMAGRLHVRLKGRLGSLITLIAPRHPQRGEDIATALRATGLKVARRSLDEPVESDTDVYLCDTLGEMGLLYRATGIAYVGKSLVPLGGQNPLEPARLDCAVVHGPHMGNFDDIVRKMKAGGASFEVEDEEHLGDVLDNLLTDETARRRLAAAARDFAEAQAGVLDAVAHELEPFLKALR